MTSVGITTRKFTRTKEDFACGHCGAVVRGNGYTNHCPVCLWGKHVDVNPGDRAHACKGMMEPAGLEQKNGEFRIIHRCVKCKAEKKNKVAENDNMDIVSAL